jgi:hypothetical protein
MINLWTLWNGQVPWLRQFTFAAVAVYGLAGVAAPGAATVSGFDSIAKDKGGQQESAICSGPTNICKTNPVSSAAQLSNPTSSAKETHRRAATPNANYGADTNLFARLTNKYDPDIVLGIVEALPPEAQRRIGYKPLASKVTNDAATSRLLQERFGYSPKTTAPPASATRQLEKEPIEARAEGTNFNRGTLVLKGSSDSGTGTAGQQKPRWTPVSQKPMDEMERRLALFFRPAQWMVFLGGLSAVAVMYLYVSWCCRQLCWRTGTPTRIAVWLPLLKRFPLFSATGVSRLWFWFGLVVPFVGLCGWALCCWRLCGAFNRSRWLTLVMVLPLVWWIPFIYLEAATRAEDDEIAVKRFKAGYAF